MAFPSVSTTDINNELYANLVAAAQFAAYESSIARQVVSVFDMPANAGKVVQVPVWAGITAQNLTDEEVATVKTTNTTSASITLTEHVVYHQITDMLRDSAYNNVLTQLGDQSGRAIAESMDTQVFALFNALTQSVGTEDSAITVDNIFDAVATLRGNKVSGPLAAIVSPRQALQLKKELATTGGANITASEIGSSILRGYYIGSLAGCAIYESALVKQDLDTDTDSELNAVGAVFAPSAFGHSMRGGIKVEEQRQASARATDLVVTATAGASTIQATHAVKLVGSATD